MHRDDPFERISYVSVPTLPGVDILSVYRSSQPWHVFHERYAFCGIRLANADWLYRGDLYHSADGSSMLLEHGETHRNTAVRKPSDFKVVFVPGDVLLEAACELGCASIPHFSTASTDDPGLFAAISALSDRVDAGEGVLAQQSAFARLLSTVLEYGERRPEPPDVRGCKNAVKRAKGYIAENFSQPVSLEDLTAVAGISRFHLIRAFARSEGLTPHAFLVHVRIAHALAPLRRGLAPTDVASMLGFSDQSHFNRHFRKIMKVTPGQYVRCLHN